MVDLVGRGFEHEGGWGGVGEVELDLVSDGRGDAGSSVADAGGDGAMVVAADNALDLGMAGDEGGEAAGVMESDAVHMGNAAAEGGGGAWR